jgi:hypothetical protein
MNLRTALELGRVSNLPTTWSNVLAGLALAGASSAQFASAPWLMLAVSLQYVGGMYLNDAFDREVDARERPSRPIPSGRVHARTVFALGYAMLAAGVALLGAIGFAAGGPGAAPLLAGLALCGCIVLYDARHKGNPLAPVVMGACRVLVYAVAAFSVQSALPSSLLVGMGALWSYLIGLSYAARQESLNRIGSVWPLACLALPLVLPLALPGFELGSPATALLLLSSLHSIYSVGFLVRTERRNVPRAVGQLIAGISLLDAALIAAQGQLFLALAAVAAWAATLLLQRVVAGT